MGDNKFFDGFGGSFDQREQSNYFGAMNSRQYYEEMKNGGMYDADEDFASETPIYGNENNFAREKTQPYSGVDDYQKREQSFKILYANNDVNEEKKSANYSQQLSDFEEKRPQQRNFMEEEPKSSSELFSSYEKNIDEAFPPASNASRETFPSMPPRDGVVQSNFYEREEVGSNMQTVGTRTLNGNLREKIVINDDCDDTIYTGREKPNFTGTRKAVQEDNTAVSEQKISASKARTEYYKDTALAQGEKVVKTFEAFKMKGSSKNGVITITNKRLICETTVKTEIDIRAVKSVSSCKFVKVKTMRLNFAFFFLLIGLACIFVPFAKLVPQWPQWASILMYVVAGFSGALAVFLMFGCIKKYFYIDIKTTPMISAFSLGSTGVCFEEIVRQDVRIKPTKSTANMLKRIGKIIIEVQAGILDDAQ